MLTQRHIAVISTSFPDLEPGSEAAGSFVSDFVEALAEHVNVTVIAPSQTHRADEHRGNLTIRRFAVSYLPLSLLKPSNLLHWPSILRTVHAGQDAIQQLTREKKVDHLLALWALPSGYWARNIWKRHGIPYSTWALGSDIWSLGKIPIIKTVLAKVLKESHVCFADGYQLKQDVERISGRSCEFLASSRNLPVVEKKRSSNTPPYRFAFLGRWHHNKGLDLLFDSLGLLSNDDWDKIEEIHICGGGPLERAVKLKVETLIRAGRPVRIGGYLDKMEAAELLAWADYLLLPSRIESIPVVFSDAMQAGCPIVATPVGDLPRLMQENKVGILADEVSPLAFVVAIRKALNMSSASLHSGIEGMRIGFRVHHTAGRLLHSLDISVPNIEANE